MIQRQQTLWLLLATVCSILTFKFSFYAGEYVEEGTTTAVFKELDAASNLFLLVLTGASIFMSAIAIFLYKDRKTQLRLTLAGAVVAVIILVLYFKEVQSFQTGNFSLTALFTGGILIGYIMAALGIRRDQKLVKSLDKLR